MSNILVFGGTGFVGRVLCEQLVQAGHRVTVPTRQLRKAAAIQHLPRLTVLEGDALHTPTLEGWLQGHDAVINLIAVLHGSAERFRAVHVEWPRQLARACNRVGVVRGIHISALGASEQGPSHYLRSKAGGEAAIWSVSQAHQSHTTAWTVLRPSVIFGAHDRFLNLFAQLQRVFPVLPLGGAGARFQPIWVHDVAQAVLHSLHTPATQGQTAELAGPEVFTLAQLVRMAGKAQGCTAPIVALPRPLAYLQALALQCLPGEPLMSTDNVASMAVDNVASPPPGLPLAQWQHRLARVGDVLPTY